MKKQSIDMEDMNEENMTKKKGKGGRKNNLDHINKEFFENLDLSEKDTSVLPWITLNTTVCRISFACKRGELGKNIGKRQTEETQAGVLLDVIKEGQTWVIENGWFEQISIEEFNEAIESLTYK